MGKIKSAICLTLVSLIIAALCFVCFVSFPYGENGIHTFNSVLSLTEKDADLGAPYGSDGYLGGGYSAVYYPEGVISARVFQDNLAGYANEDEKNRYEESYVPYADGALYLDKREVCEGGDKPTEKYMASFQNTLKLLEKRYAELRKDGLKLEVRDGLSVGLFLPKDLMTNEFFVLERYSYMGEFTVRYASSSSTSAEDADIILPARSDKTIRDYVKNVATRTAADGTIYIMIEFTDLGREVVAAKTADASSAIMYFTIGDESVLPQGMTVSEAIDQEALYVSGSYSAESALACVTAIKTALNFEEVDDTLTLTVADTYRYEALYGVNSLYAMYIAFGVCFLGMMIYFFVRYRLLAFAHMLSYLLFLVVMVLCVWSIPFIYISTETFLAFLIASVLFAVSNVWVFERARKEYALGKTIESSVKNAYKSNLWHIFDLHIVIAALGFLLFGIGITNLSAFGFVLGLSTVFSGLSVLGSNRFMWAITMAFTRNKGKFCNFKREVEDDD